MIMIPYCILAIEDESDREFMADLYTRYNRLMFKRIINIVDNQWAAEDVLHTVVLNLIGKVKELRVKEESKLTSYIVAACRYRSYSYLSREKKRMPFALADDYDVPDPDSEGNPLEAQLIRMEELDRLAVVWPKLDEKTRFLLEARYMLEKTDREIAQDLGIKPDSARMALTRARKAAQKAMLAEESKKV